jgi:small nuclear ribonucleoprotein G
VAPTPLFGAALHRRRRAAQPRVRRPRPAARAATAKMAKPQPPELKKYLDKRLSLKLNANRQVTGVLRGFDVFMNLVLDEALEDVSPTEKARLGMVVRARGGRASVGGRWRWWRGCVARRASGLPPVVVLHLVCAHDAPHTRTHRRPLYAALQVIRGNSIIQLECLDRIS